MSGRLSSATERAMKRWTPGADLNRLAVVCGINPSTLYRALIRAGMIQKRGK